MIKYLLEAFSYNNILKLLVIYTYVWKLFYITFIPHNREINKTIETQKWRASCGLLLHFWFYLCCFHLRRSQLSHINFAKWVSSSNYLPFDLLFVYQHFVEPIIKKYISTNLNPMSSLEGSRVFRLMIKLQNIMIVWSEIRYLLSYMFCTFISV